MKTISIILAALFSVAAAAAAGDCKDSFSVESSTKTYVSATDILQSENIDPFEWKGGYFLQQAVGLADAIANHLTCAKVNLVSVEATASPGGFSSDINYTGLMRSVASQAASFATDGVEANGLLPFIVPTFAPCPNVVLNHDFVHFSGNISAYIEQAGIGIYTRKVVKGKFHLCRDIVVLNNSGASIEIPLSISGEVDASGSFGINEKCYAKAHMSLQGSIGGQAVSSRVEVKIDRPEQFDLGLYFNSINETRHVIIPPSASPQSIRIDLSGEAECDVQAAGPNNGGVIGGLITAAATSACRFPGSIHVGLPTGLNGVALPSGVRVYDADDGSVYLDSTANPVDVVPVPGQTPIWDFSLPLDTFIGGAVSSITAYGDTTIYSPPGTPAGLVRRADGDADPLASVTNHNAFQLSYTVADTNTTSAITIFIYDKTGGATHAIAYDLSGDQLTPGYHEITLPYGTTPVAYPISIGRSGTNILLTWVAGTLQQADTANGPFTDVNTAASPYNIPLITGQKFFRLRFDYTGGDTSGRGVFAPAAPDFTRLHSITIANTLITNWPAQSSLVTTGLLAITFNHLAAVDAAATGFTGFAITNNFLDASRRFHLRYPSDANDYYLLYWGSVVTAITNPIAMNLGVDGPGEFIVSNNAASAFFRLREVPLAQPLDVDGDGIDDVTEFHNPSLYNPFTPVVTITTNSPPDPGTTNSPSNSGQLYTWTLNGHTYMPVLVTNGITWEQANASAQSAGGHLATITSALENNFVFALIDRPEYWTPNSSLNATVNIGPWLGGWQPDGSPEPAGGWIWVTAEPFSYTNWNALAPDNGGGGESRLHFFALWPNRGGTWNDDVPNDPRVHGYIIEFEPPVNTSPCIPRNGLVSWWRADGNALDSVGTNNGILVSGTSFTNGISGQAFNLNGTSSYVAISNGPIINSTRELSVSVWVNLRHYKPQPSSNIILAKDNFNANKRDYLLEVGLSGTGNTASFDAFTTNAPNGRVEVSGGAVSLNTWHHLTGTYNGTNALLYLDGALVASTAFLLSTNDTLNSTDTPLLIGGNNDTCCNRLCDGLVDDVLIYNRALGTNEIADIYNAGLTGHCGSQCVPPPSGLVAWWPGEGNANDNTGANNGSLLNGTSFARGVVGQAFSFDNTNDAVEISNANGVFDLTNAWTICAWAFPKQNGWDVRNDPIIWKNSRADRNQDTFYLAWGAGNTFATGLEEYSVQTDGRNFGIASASHSPGQFYFVVGRYDGNALSVFVNGVLEGSTNIGHIVAYTGAEPLRIGNLLNSTHGNAGVFDGLIDEPMVFNRALSAGEIAGIYLAGSAGMCPKPDCSDPPQGLVAWWPADGNANDLVGTNNGTLLNGATFTNGIVGQAFNLDGVNDYVDIGQGFNLDDMTVIAWVFIDPAFNTGERRIISKDNFLVSEPRKFFALQSSSPYASGHNGRPDFVVGIGPQSSVTNGSAYLDIIEAPFSLGLGWHHLAGVRQAGAGRLELFVDGALAAQAGNVNVVGPVDSSARLVIGQVGTNFPAFFHGLIDDVMIFNRALTASEIQSLYQSVPPPAPASAVDHGGTNLFISANTTLSGTHINIGQFVISNNATLTVSAFDGASGGQLEIRAQRIRVDGVINAIGAGYPGGGAGGGGGGADQIAGGQPGNGALGGAGYLGSSTGASGANGGNTTGGNGGNGGLAFSNSFALFAGAGGIRGSGAANGSDNPAGQNGRAGGYFGISTNGDTTTDDTVLIGPGGGGGGGGGGGHSLNVNSGGGGGGSGGSGGFGGGAIILRAAELLQINGTLLTQGTLGVSGTNGSPGTAYTQSGDVSPGGNGGRGAAAGNVGAALGANGGAHACDTAGGTSGNCSGDGGRGGNGGAGAGGGILLRAPLINLQGIINTSGGSSTINGGTVKILSTCGGSATNGVITAGRVYVKGILMR